MVTFSHVAGGGIVGARRENNVSLFIDAHDPTLPQKSFWELDVYFANINGF